MNLRVDGNDLVTKLEFTLEQGVFAACDAAFSSSEFHHPVISLGNEWIGVLWRVISDRLQDCRVKSAYNLVINEEKQYAVTNNVGDISD